jgi:hypothetical protein
MQAAQIDKTPIDVVAALRESPYEEVAELLAGEFAAARITIKGMVQNAPLKLRKTFGVDVYKVMELILAHEGPPAPLSKKTKKSS